MLSARSAQRSRRGFTLLELMNFIGLAAVITALAMYGVARYVRHAKTAESIGSVTAIAQHAAEFYNDSDANQPAGANRDRAKAMRHFPAASRASVPADPADICGKRYQSAIGDWSGAPWIDLHFSMTQPQSYAYAFESGGSGASARASAIARGDLDGNSVRSTFSASVTPDESMTAKVDPTIARTDPEE
jgi:hypothetical protein